MGNMFCLEFHIHRRFDRKGSSQGFSTYKVEIEETTTLKYLDLDFVFYLEPSRRHIKFMFFTLRIIQRYQSLDWYGH